MAIHCEIETSTKHSFNHQEIVMKFGVFMFPTDYSMAPQDLAKAAEERKKGKRVKRVARPKFGTKAFRARLRKLREGLASRK